jgi:hypothetical protein
MRRYDFTERRTAGLGSSWLGYGNELRSGSWPDFEIAHDRELPKRPSGFRFGRQRDIRNPDFLQSSHLTEEVYDLEVGVTVVGMASEWSGLNAADGCLGEPRCAEPKPHC